MNIRLGSHVFINVEIPLLWGTRAVLLDKKGRLSVINLADVQAIPEIVGDEPAPDVTYSPTVDGFEIRDTARNETLYSYSPSEKTLASISLGLPDCTVTLREIRIGSNLFSGNVIEGHGVGIAVTVDGISVGAALPAGLAKLVV